jgi:hypothetical protein
MDTDLSFYVVKMPVLVHALTIYATLIKSRNISKTSLTVVAMTS